MSTVLVLLLVFCQKVANRINARLSGDVMLTRVDGGECLSFVSLDLPWTATNILTLNFIHSAIHSYI
jgi:hypothetical protein